MRNLTIATVSMKIFQIQVKERLDHDSMKAEKRNVLNVVFLGHVRLIKYSASLNFKTEASTKKLLCRLIFQTFCSSAGCPKMDVVTF